MIFLLDVTISWNCYNYYYCPLSSLSTMMSSWLDTTILLVWSWIPTWSWLVHSNTFGGCFPFFPWYLQPILDTDVPVYYTSNLFVVIPACIFPPYCYVLYCQRHLCTACILVPVWCCRTWPLSILCARAILMLPWPVPLCWPWSQPSPATSMFFWFFWGWLLLQPLHDFHLPVGSQGTCSHPEQGCIALQ